MPARPEPTPARGRWPPPTSNPDGYGPVRPSVPAADPPIDCFYVYPTVSRDPGMNSDLGRRRGGARRGPVRPLRLGLPDLRAALPPGDAGRDPAGARGAGRRRQFQPRYGDVRAAWRYYLDHYNNGRPFVLIGHSQGTIHATRLLAEEIENGPAAARHAVGAADRLCGRGAGGAGRRRQPATDAALHTPRSDRLRRHLYVVPRREPAGRRRADGPRRPRRA